MLIITFIFIFLVPTVNVVTGQTQPVVDVARRYVLVTGASTGIGLDVAVKYAQLGFHVYGTGANAPSFLSR